MKKLKLIFKLKSIIRVIVMVLSVIIVVAFFLGSINPTLITALLICEVVSIIWGAVGMSYGIFNPLIVVQELRDKADRLEYLRNKIKTAWDSTKK